MLGKFTHTDAYLQKAKWPDGTTNATCAVTPRKLDDPTTSNVKTPLFFAQAGDALLLGFDISETQAIGTAKNMSDPGWFFVFEEAYGETHFGMDDTPNAPLSPLDFWDDLYWSHATSDTGFVDLTSNVEVIFNQLLLGDIKPAKNLADLDIDFGRNAADNAYALFQKPVRLSIHANELLK